MKFKAPWLLGFALAAAAAILVFSDPSSTSLRFLATLIIVVILLAVPLSMLVTHFFGRAALGKLWSTLILLGISIGVSLVAAEYAIRFVYRDVTTTSDNASFFARRWYSVHPPKLNELGFRDRDVPKSKSPNTYRIAIIGDSLTYGQGISADARFSNLIQIELNNSPGQFEVFNFGRPGAETDGHLRILNDVVLDLAPDFVLIQWFVNDVELSKTNRPAAMPLIPWNFASKRLHAKSALYYLIDSQWYSLQIALGLLEDYDNNMIRRFSDPDTEESRNASVALDRLIQRLKSQNIPTGMVLFPMLRDVRGDLDKYRLGFLIDRVLAVCNVNDVPCVDLRPVFAEATDASELWANRLDHHPSAAANKMAGAAILDKFGSSWMPIKQP